MMIHKLKPPQVPLVLALLTVAFFLHVVLGDALPGSDFRQFVYHIMQFMLDSWRQEGTPPLWNPHQFLGYSVVGNPQYLLFYLPNWLILGAVGVYRGVGVMVALHTFIGAWGMAAYTRLWGAKPIPAVLAGVVFAFGAFPMARVYAGHYTMILALAWLPWIVGAFQKAVFTGSAAWAVAGGVGLALQIFAGHPQITYLTLLLLALHGAFAWWEGQKMGRYALVLLGIGLALSAASWLPIVDYNGKTVRGVDAPSLAFVDEFAIPANQLTTLFIPNLYGNPMAEGGYWGEPFYEEMSAYVGLLPLLLLPIVPSLRRRVVWFWLLLVALGVVMSLGVDGGLSTAAYRWLPLVSSFRAPGRALILSLFALASLLALALTHLLELSAAERRAALRPLLTRILPVLLGLVWGAVLVYEAFDASRPYRVEQLATTGVFLLLWAGVLWVWTLAPTLDAGRWALLLTCVLLVVDVWRVSWVLTETQALSLDPIWQEAQYDVPASYSGRVMQLPPIMGTPNGASTTGHYTPQGYDPLAPVEWARLNALADFNPAHPINRLFGVRYTLSALPMEHYAYPDTENFQLIGLRAGFAFYENPAALPRVYFASGYEVANPAAVLERIAAGETDDGFVFLDTLPDCETGAGIAEIVAYTPNAIHIQTNTTHPALLVLSDQYDDDWRVWVAGTPATLLRVNTTLRGVCVPAGEALVTLRYRPAALQIGLGISAMGGVLLLGFIFRRWARTGWYKT